jgi:hypothetical protein
VLKALKTSTGTTWSSSPQVTPRTNRIRTPAFRTSKNKSSAMTGRRESVLRRRNKRIRRENAEKDGCLTPTWLSPPMTRDSLPMNQIAAQKIVLILSQAVVRSNAASVRATTRRISV